MQEVNEDVVYSIRAQIPWAPSRVPDLPTAIVQGLLEVGSMSLVAPKHHQSIQGHIKSGIRVPYIDGVEIKLQPQTGVLRYAGQLKGHCAP